MTVIFQLILIVSFACGTMFLATQSGLILLSPVIFIFVITPIIDWVWKHNPTGNFFSKPSAQDFKYEDVPIYVYSGLNVISLLFYFYNVQGDNFGDVMLKALAGSMFHGGAAVVHGHEFCHRQSKLKKFLGNLTLAGFGYGHFSLEHVQGHHKMAATPEDPSSARYHESVWSFLPRTILGQLRSAVKLELKNIKNKKWKFESSMLTGFGWTAILFFGSYFFSGVNGVIFFISHCIFSILLLEFGNYVEHYGLSRKINKLKYEKFEAQHSWSSDAPLTNIILFNLPYHSSHHINSNYSYLNLVNEVKAPKLPYGHFVMILIAAYPPLWYKVINPRIKKHQESLSSTC